MGGFRVTVVLAVLAMPLATPAIATAAGSPVATTGTATAIGSISATLNGTVSANKQSTTSSFDYGTTMAYGANASAGTVNGNAGKSVSATISGLTPSTVYHFRLTATNASGQSTGQDMTFTTAATGPPPYAIKNAVSIAVAPGTVTYGRSAVISGRVTGPKKSGGVQVLVQAQPLPFTAPFQTIGAAASAAANGRYSLTIAPRLRTSYHAVANTAPPATSAAVVVNVRYAVSFFASSATVRRGARVRFFGSVRPSANGRTVYIQRRSRTGRYHTVAKTLLRPTGSRTRSSYSKRRRVVASGTYRVHIRGHGGYAASNSGLRTITVR
jgi:hypothetical protein